MKTHILLTTLLALFMTACASHEGRKISSTSDSVEKETEYSQQNSVEAKDLSKD